MKKIKVNYPKEFAGVQFLKQGTEHEVSEDVANTLVEKGIAKIIGDVEPEPKQEEEKAIVGTVYEVAPEKDPETKKETKK